MTRDMTERERREIRECQEMLGEVFEVCDSDAARQAVRAGLDAVDAFLKRGQVFEAEDHEDDEEGEGSR